MNVNKLYLHYHYINDKEGMLTLKDENNDLIVNKLLFQSSIKTGLSDLAAVLHQVSNTPQNIPKGNVDLAGYLFALSTVGELPSDELMDELTRCNTSVNQARENLKNGRPNIMSDLINRPQLGRELAFVRTKEINGYTIDQSVTLYASSLYFSMGNCQEHSIHTQFIHSQHCQKDEFVTRMISEEINHEWAESNSCVMDSWANGPAVLKKDVGSISANAIRESISKEEGHEFLAESAVLLKALETFSNDGRKLKAEIESKTNLHFIFSPETSVINKRLENALTTKGFASSQKEPTSVNSQIRATGVLRSLATAMGKEVSVKDATSGSDEVINAFNNRFMTGYLGQWHSK